jgi:hypothetical protein
MNSYTCSDCNKNLIDQFVISCKVCGKILCLDCFEDNDGLCIDCLMSLEDDSCIREYMEENR